jgi:hypothetical protein
VHENGINLGKPDKSYCCGCGGEAEIVEDSP